MGLADVGDRPWFLVTFSDRPWVLVTEIGTVTAVGVSVFQDVHVMMFIGFGFLMTFLKFYGYSAVAVNMLLAVFVLQVALIVRGFIYADIAGGEKFPINITE